MSLYIIGVGTKVIMITKNGRALTTSSQTLDREIIFTDNEMKESDNVYKFRFSRYGIEYFVDINNVRIVR